MLHLHPISHSEATGSRNRLLSELPRHELDALLIRLERVNLASRQELMRQGTPIDALYFPETALVAVEVDGDDVMIVGRDGLVGLAPVLGEEVAPITSVVLVGGQALRARISVIVEAMAELPSLRALLHRHISERIVDLARAGACARTHPLPARLATLLLTLRERSGADWLPLTHERIARLIGSSRRASVTDILSAWAESGIVERRRGALGVRDAAGLRAVACSCASRTSPQSDEAAPPALLAPSADLVAEAMPQGDS